ncbi:DUF4440 domain-containing protein [Enterobacteriaceae bacterium H4N4]|uniref:DUF4440 domain-containing protein n=1 Tax=Silvania confinis TaxID=2926470 RepID=A0A9J6QE25_9ENTR|nr:DUF4440 domain-containing protein [Silvania confinis]MCU6668491.1 DUF4440 domain-containing protein [Silvania confinis]
MNAYTAEIIDAHIALEQWLGQGEGDLTALLARFRPDFMMIAPTGAHFDHAGLAQFLQNQRGSRPGLKIMLDELTLLQSWENGALLHYRETQTRPEQPVNVRWSTAVLTQEGDNITWRLLHETSAQP